MGEFVGDIDQRYLEELINLCKIEKDNRIFRNSLFDFDSRERAQDSLIYWIANWTNAEDTDCKDPNIAGLKQLGKSFVGKLAGIDSQEVDDVVSKSQFNTKYGYIDILLVVNRRIVVIVEDKVGSTNNDQLRRYREGIEQLLMKDERPEPLDIVANNATIRTVYIKTGYFFDNDYRVLDKACKANSEADLAINAKGLLSLLIPKGSVACNDDFYIGFIFKLCEWISEYNERGNLTAGNVEKYRITQYYLMRRIFNAQSDRRFTKDRPRISPEGLDDREATDDERRVDFVDQGTAKHTERPFTTYRIFGRREKGAKYPDFVWWRIDSIPNRPFLSLKLYNYKNDPRHKRLCMNLFNVLDCVAHKYSGGQLQGFLISGLEHNRYKCNTRSGGIRGQVKFNYNECDLVHLYLTDLLNDWNDHESELVEFAHSISRLIIEIFKIEDGRLVTADPMNDERDIESIAEHAATASGLWSS